MKKTDGEAAPLNPEFIECWARKAADIAYRLLGLRGTYSIVQIDEPSIEEDGRLNTQTNTIELNLALLCPFPPESTGSRQFQNEYERLRDENYRAALKVCYVVFHEMRHLYQVQVVQAYNANQMLGSKLVPQPENDKKCMLWKAELSCVPSDGEIETDANEFAYYLTNRYPVKIPMMRTSRRIGAFKRRYDRITL